MNFTNTRSVRQSRTRAASFVGANGEYCSDYRSDSLLSATEGEVENEPVVPTASLQPSVAYTASPREDSLPAKKRVPQACENCRMKKSRVRPLFNCAVPLTKFSVRERRLVACVTG
jgi:hypothetical protein